MNESINQNSMTYSFTIFKNIYDNKTDRRMDFNSYDDFKSLLFKLSDLPGYKPRKGERNENSSVLISPAIYKPGTTRKNENVIAWGGWIALDVDDVTEDMSSALRVFERYEYICYSSASSTESAPKFRIVLPTTRNIDATEIRHVWYACNKEFNSLGDPQTKDLSRMYYVPARYPGSFHFIHSHAGEHLDPSKIMAAHSYISPSSCARKLAHALPENIKEKLIEYRKENLNNRSYVWSGWRDCPFINRNLVQDYFMIQNSGWYRQMYSIMLSVAGKALRCGYPITPQEIACICREIDTESGSWYKNRNMETEAARAIEFACRNL